MGQFKPMVKMMTTEPTVELKLKKGGSAHKKMTTKGEHGHKPMAHKMDGGVMGALAGATPVIAGRTAAPVARVPARPSLAARRRAMIARPIKKGGEVESKAEHASEMKKISKVEHELKSHEGKKASTAHKGLKKGGKCYAEGGLAKSGIINTEDQGGEYRNTKMHSAEKTDKSPANTGEVKLGNAGGYKTGGVIKGNAGGYKTGGVALGNAGGFKKGGSSKKAYASGGSVNDEGKATSMPQGAKKPSTPVRINQLSGTFKKGGDVSSKKLQNVFKEENAPALKASKKDTNEVYSVYGAKKKTKHFVGGGMAEDDTTGYKIPMSSPAGNIIDSAYESVKRASGDEDTARKDALKAYQKSKQKTVIDKSEKKYPSGLTDADIDKVLSSKQFREGASHFSDYKRGGKAKK